jgi:hypothetical protein
LPRCAFALMIFSIVTESLFENSAKAPREGTRPTGNGQNFKLL